MRQPLLDPAQSVEYHAHVYYRPETRTAADTLRHELETRFTVGLGRWHDALVGPHTRSMYQVAFAPAVFADVVPWLLLNRGPLDLLIHPETRDDLTDHRDHAMWLGEKLPLRLQVFGKTN
jgi:aromatic ring-cleaving dioxygenase